MKGKYIILTDTLGEVIAMPKIYHSLNQADDMAERVDGVVYKLEDVYAC